MSSVGWSLQHSTNCYQKGQDHLSSLSSELKIPSYYNNPHKSHICRCKSILVLVLLHHEGSVSHFRVDTHGSNGCNLSHVVKVVVSSQRRIHQLLQTFSNSQQRLLVETPHESSSIGYLLGLDICERNHHFCYGVTWIVPSNPQPQCRDSMHENRWVWRGGYH